MYSLTAPKLFIMYAFLFLLTVCNWFLTVFFMIHLSMMETAFFFVFLIIRLFVPTFIHSFLRYRIRSFDPKLFMLVGLLIIIVSLVVSMINVSLLISAVCFYVGLTIAQQGFWIGVSSFAVNNNAEGLNAILTTIKNVGFVVGLLMVCFVGKEVFPIFIVIIAFVMLCTVFITFNKVSNEYEVTENKKLTMKIMMPLVLVFISTLDYFIVLLIMKEYEFSAIVFVLCIAISALAIPFAERLIVKVNISLFVSLFFGGYIALLLVENAISFIIINFIISFSYVVLTNYFLWYMTEDEGENYFYWSEWIVRGANLLIGLGSIVLNIKLLFAIAIAIGLLAMLLLYRKIRVS